MGLSITQRFSEAISNIERVQDYVTDKDYPPTRSELEYILRRFGELDASRSNLLNAIQEKLREI